MAGSCEKDFIAKESVSDKEESYHIETKSYHKLCTEPRFVSAMNEIFGKKKSDGTSVQGKSVMEEQ